MKRFMSLMILATLFIVAKQAMAAPSLLDIQHQWADCQYRQVHNKKVRIKCFQKNIASNKQALKARPNNPQLLVWLGINEGSLAGAKGGFGALSLAKDAKKRFEQVIQTAPNTLNGAAYTSLGTLYQKVPGWPIGFGSDDKAETMLKKGLSLNPDGIDANFFYGEFLASKDRKKEALIYLNQAKHAMPRPDRPLADQGRQQDIKKAIANLK